MLVDYKLDAIWYCDSCSVTTTNWILINDDEVSRSCAQESNHVTLWCEAPLPEGWKRVNEETYCAHCNQRVTTLEKPALLNPDALTPREVEVAALLLDGFTNVQIGEALEISRSTAMYHVANIVAKTHSSNRTQAAVKYALGQVLTKNASYDRERKTA